MNIGLVLLMLATSDLFKHWGWHVPLPIHFFAGLVAIYLVCDFWGIWDWIFRTLSPSEALASKNDQASSATNPLERGLHLLLIPYYIVLFLLWHYHGN